MCKTFKISRITKAEILKNKQYFTEKHKKNDLDVFRMSGTEQIPVKLRLSIKAYNLLIEEFPRAEIYTKNNKENSYIFETKISSLYGIGRFVLGLPEDIEIVYPQELKDYVSETIKRAIKKLK